MNGLKWIAKDIRCYDNTYHMGVKRLSYSFQTNSGSLISLVVTKSHVCYQLGGDGLDWGRFQLGSNSLAVPVVYLTMLRDHA